MTDIRGAYNRHFLDAELLLSGVICLFLIYSMNRTWSSLTIREWISANKREIYPLVATIAGTLLGFVITGVSIIIAFSGSEKLALLRKSPHFKTMFTIYFSTMKLLAITTIIAVSGIVVDDKWAIRIFYLMLWSVIISSFGIWRCFWVLENIAKITL